MLLLLIWNIAIVSVPICLSQAQLLQIYHLYCYREMILNCNNIMKFFWNIMKYQKYSWNIHEISWNILKYHEIISWNIKNPSWNLQCPCTVWSIKPEDLCGVHESFYTSSTQVVILSLSSQCLISSLLSRFSVFPQLRMPFSH